VVKNTEGTISYNGWSFSQQERLFTASLLTPASPQPVRIGNDTVGTTVAGAKFMGQGNDLVLDTSSFYKPTKPDAYPIVLASCEIVCSKYPDPEVGKAAKAFLQSTIGPGQTGLSDNGYIPLPDQFQSRVADAVNAVDAAS
jgi:phosphate transport system substrate-binding protein